MLTFQWPHTSQQLSEHVLQRSDRYAMCHVQLSREALLTSIHALLVSKLDYCNSVLVGTTKTLQRRLQSVFNAASRLVFLARRSEHVTLLLRDLHWLKVPELIQFRLCVLAYRCLHGIAPSYLAETLHIVSSVESHRRLRSGSTSTLLVPTTRRTIYLAIEHFQSPLQGPEMLCRRLSELLNHTLRSGDT